MLEIPRRKRCAAIFGGISSEADAFERFSITNYISTLIGELNYQEGTANVRAEVLVGGQEVLTKYFIEEIL